MIYVTGDTHANIDIEKLNTTKFPQQKNLTKDDYLIICGDFGLCWDGSRRRCGGKTGSQPKISPLSGLTETTKTLICYTSSR